MVNLKDVNKLYPETKKSYINALKDINLSFSNSGLVFIVGKSGSGKTTLLNLLSGIDKPTSGEITLFGKEFSKFKDNDYDNYRNTFTGFVFQDFLIFEDLDIEENLRLALSLQNKKINQEVIDECLKKVNLFEYKNKKCSNLSGGQKQRVAIARALIKKPKIVFADEPTGNLDFETGEQIYGIFKELSKDILVIIVSHDTFGAKKYSDRIIELKSGKVIKDSNVEENIENDESVTFKRGKISLGYSLFLGLHSFKRKIGRMILDVLAITLTLMFFLVSIMYSEISNRNSWINSIRSSEMDFLVIKNEKNVNGYTYDEAIAVMEEYNFDTALAINCGYPIYSYVETTNQSSYYPNALSLKMIELNDNFQNYYATKLTNNSHMPNNPNEILITSYMAEQYIRFGYKYVLYDEITMEVASSTNYQINEIEDMLGKEISLVNYGKGVLKIVGIVDYDTTVYDLIKDYDPSQGSDFSNASKQISMFNDFLIAENFYLCNVFVHEDFLLEDYDNDFFLTVLVPEDINTLLDLKSNLAFEKSALISPIDSNYEVVISTISTFGSVMLYVSIFFGIFCISVIYNYLNKTIEDDKRKIGMLRAIGARKLDILKIYVMQSIFWIITLGILFIGFGFLAQLLGGVITGFFPNSLLGKEYLITSPMFDFRGYFLVLLVVCVAVILATIIPIIRITIKPIKTLLKYEG